MTSAGRLPGAFWVLFAATLVNRMGNILFSLLTLYVTQGRGLSVGTAALSLSCYGFGTLAGGLSGGLLADRLGRKPTMVGSLVVFAAVLVLLSLAHESTAIYAAAALGGFFTESYRPGAAAAVADLVREEHRGRAYGLLYWASNIGFTLAVPIATWMATIWSYEATLLANAGATLGSAALLALGLPRIRRPPVRQPSARPPLQRAPHLGALLLVTFLGFLFFAVILQGYTTLSYVLVASGFGVTDYGWAMAVSGAAVVLGTIPINRLADRSRRGLALAAASLILGVGFGLHGLATSLPLHLVAVLIWTVAEIILEPLAPAIVAGIARTDLRGRFLGVWGSSRGLAYLVAPPIGAALFEQGGGRLLWSSCLAVGLVAAGGWLLADRRYRRAEGFAAFKSDASPPRPS